MIQFAKPDDPRAVWARTAPGVRSCIVNRRRRMPERRSYAPHWRDKWPADRRSPWGPNSGGRRRGER